MIKTPIKYLDNEFRLNNCCNEIFLKLSIKNRDIKL